LGKLRKEGIDLGLHHGYDRAPEGAFFISGALPHGAAADPWKPLKPTYTIEVRGEIVTPEPDKRKNYVRAAEMLIMAKSLARQELAA
jgi:hypothetical protein